MRVRAGTLPTAPCLASGGRHRRQGKRKALHDLNGTQGLKSENYTALFNIHSHATLLGTAGSGKVKVQADDRDRQRRALNGWHESFSNASHLPTAAPALTG